MTGHGSSEVRYNLFPGVSPFALRAIPYERQRAVGLLSSIQFLRMFFFESVLMHGMEL
jgi:hypothetical protein